MFEARAGFFIVEPEAAGAPAAGATADAVSCVFDAWLGDELVRAHPFLLATTSVGRALLNLPDASGFRVARARVRASAFFRQQNPGRRLPPFWALAVDGEPGRDDMGLTPDGALVVSRRVLDALLEFSVGRAVFAQYTRARGRPRAREEPGGRRV
ncbi:MAG: hypothetical protein ACM3PV_00445 [Betaproteobacteria bacterium]